MRLWHFAEPITGGCFHYRDAVPLVALSARGHHIHTSLDLDSCVIADWDGFLFSRTYFERSEFAPFLAEIKEADKPFIYDVDDAWDLLPGWHPEYLSCQELTPSYYHLLHEATLVTTTTDRLAAHLRGLGARRVSVLPNTTTPALPFQAPRRSADRVRVGFAGTVGHLDDICIWLEALALLRSRVPIQPIMMGLGLLHNEDGSVDGLDTFLEKSRQHMERRHKDWPGVLDRFEAALRPVVDWVEWRPSVETQDYWSTFMGLDLDIGCIPLAETPFNACKSFSKFYEYATRGALTLASPVLHSGEPVVQVRPNTAQGWARTLAHYLTQPDLRYGLAEAQQEWVRESRSPKTWAAIRERTYRLVVQDALVSACA